MRQNILLSAAVVMSLTVAALGQGGQAPAPPQPAKAAAPIDLTGTWVSIITEDWRWRMVTPAKGDYVTIPINAEAKKVADGWDPAKDEAAGEQCRSYGAPAIMRVPGRLRISWQDDNTLKVETDAGTQTRLLHFGDWKAPGGEATWQGDSVARWETPRAQRGAGVDTNIGGVPTTPETAPAAGRSAPATAGRGTGRGPAAARFGSLKVTTTHIRPGYLRKNGIPYSADAVLTEHWDLMKESNGAQWLVVTSLLDDSKYLTAQFVTSPNFRKEPDGIEVGSVGVLIEVVKRMCDHEPSTPLEPGLEAPNTTRKRSWCLRAALALSMTFASGPAFAELDLSGMWANRLHEDFLERAPGPRIGDYMGLPINDEGRARADAWQISIQTMPERQCILYTTQYLVMGPQSFKMLPDIDPISGRVTAWRITGTVDRAPHLIWMDGRPHPGKYAPHTAGGFSTGVWEGDMLTVTTTHLKEGMVWRNGVPHSDQATMTEHYARHGTTMTVTMIVDDPIYFEEPFIRSASFQFDPAGRVLPEPCEPQVEIPRKEGEVPHYLPSTNPFIDEMAKLYGIPIEAVRGGAATTYPEYRKKIKDSYKAPEKCAQDCGGPPATPAAPAATPAGTAPLPPTPPPNR